VSVFFVQVRVDRIDALRLRLLLKIRGVPAVLICAAAFLILRANIVFQFVARKSPLRLSERCDREKTHISVYLCFARRFWLRRSAIAHKPTTYFWNEFSSGPEEGRNADKCSRV